MTAVRTHHTQVVTKKWDGDRVEAKLPDDLPPQQLKQIFAYVDDDPKSDDTYKFPHHEVTKQGRAGAANLRALSNAVAVLNGGRGGADIPASERRRIYNHLAAHMRDAGKEPPPLK